LLSRHISIIDRKDIVVSVDNWSPAFYGAGFPLRSIHYERTGVILNFTPGLGDNLKTNTFKTAVIKLQKSDFAIIGLGSGRIIDPIIDPKDKVLVNSFIYNNFELIGKFCIDDMKVKLLRNKKYSKYELPTNFINKSCFE